ncbi:carotenoid oxygenase family protein [Leptolyngbya sp. PCC 6406]|uniref:carotenoid oxygenase family protein n=1 Tax=Leptolyngbya sp. PCC 6406 TaxID=1173264 RepID=UPI0002ACA98F|nr:carotenoid oxygenase family protein [Leptolyngbya sp. PCC 6406]
MPTLPASTATTDLSYTLADWRSGYRSQPKEFAYWIDAVEGVIPPELSGTLFRNGPGLLDIHEYPVRHPFDGDGMISSIAFSQGRAYYRNRFVQTAGYVAEQQAQKPLYRGVFGTQKPGGLWANAFDLRLKNIANTHVIYWGQKLLALWEAAEPHRLDPTTLETLGLDNLDGLLQPGDAFAAHPRIDPGDGGVPPRLVTFSLKAGMSSTITLLEFDAEGRLLHRDGQESASKGYRTTVPGFAFLHDFAITPNYAIFFQNPVSFNPLGFILGSKGAAECIHFNPKQPTKVLLIPRQGQGAVITVEAPPCFVFHHANAFEEDGQVVIDSIAYRKFPSLDEGMGYEMVDFSQLPEGQLCRFTVDVATRKLTAKTLVERCCEFPTLHRDRVGRPYRYLYIGAAHQPTGNAPLQALLKRDLLTGEEQMWSEAPRGFMGEPIFVPRPGATVEDDGWVLCLTYNAARQCSDVIIVNGQNISAGPIARLKLHHHVPYGLHGSFTETYFGP